VHCHPVRGDAQARHAIAGPINCASRARCTGRSIDRRVLHARRDGPGVTEDEMRKRLAALRMEHRDLDAAIDALTSAGISDQLQVARLKKRKLRLKDQISLIEDHLIPDIIA
jgi:hypothetical protein